MQSAVSEMFSMYDLLVPSPVRTYLQSVIHSFFSKHSTVRVHELLNGGMIRNQIYDAAEVYLCTKISSDTKRFSIGKTTKQKSLSISLEIGEEILDWFGDDMELKWKKKSIESQNNNRNEKRLFELTFNKKFMDRVLKEYVPFVLSESKEITDNEDKVVKLYTRASTPGGNDGLGGGGPGGWSSINLDHPATFETMAMEPELKKAIKDDLKRFLKRKDFYKKVGKAWKRGYLLYGPPGTGKSSLIAAIANHLNFDIYDLELTSLYYDSDLRRMLVSTTNRSILVIEDVDCSVEMQDRQLGLERVEQPNDGRRSKLTLSGLLNFIDGLWSSCGDERIIILTTNYIDKLDPALLRPGRMDMHIPMSYCTNQGFKILASKYLSLDDHHKLFGKIKGLIGKIKGLIEKVEATPAELAEELMKSEDAEIALTGVVNLLKRKKMEGNEIEEVEGCETKRFKIERNRRKFVRKK